MSKHATVRSQQRGIPSQLVDMILKFGTPQRKPGSALEYKLTKRDKTEIIMRLKRFIQVLDKVTGKAVLVVDDDIVTVYQQTKRSDL